MEYTALNSVDSKKVLGFSYNHNKTGRERGRVVGRYTAGTQLVSASNFLQNAT